MHEPGYYQFVFDNRRGKELKQITFAVDVHNATTDVLQHHDLSPLEKKIETIAVHLMDVKQETQFSAKREMSFFQKLEQTNVKLMIMSAFETIAIIGGTIWQTWYIKKILDNRRIV